jgi:SAM-dependent methyltransferase
MTEYTDANRRLWDEWTGVHERSAFYDLESFKSGREKRHPFEAAPGVRVRTYEVEEIGEVGGKDLLHLQCHFGIDTLSWARLGANVTGIDFSAQAVELARGLAAELGLDARFVVSSVQDLEANLDGEFDIVYTSRGAIWWLADLEGWARTVEQFLRPGGVFYITEFHPIMQTLDDASGLREPRVKYPYFPRAEPQSFPVSGSYADHDATIEADIEYGWSHSLAEIVTAVASSGLHIDFLHEFDWVDHRYIALLEESDDGRWKLPSSTPGELPLMYSLRATKPR